MTAARGESKSGCSDHDDLGADLHPLVKIDDVLVAHTDAARGYICADGPWLVRAVNAIKARAKIKGARAERIVDAAGHETRQIGLARDHFDRRPPIRPFALGGYVFTAAQRKPGRPTPIP